MKKTKIIIFFLLIIFNFFGYNLSNASSGDYGQLGGNTDNLVDWSRNWIFADSVKQVRQFVVGLPRSSTGAKLGEDGYPLEDFAGVIMTAQEVGSIAGTYHGTLTVRNDAPDVSFNLGATAGTVINKTLSGKTLTFDAVIGTGANQIMFNVNKTNGGVSDFHLYRPGYGSGDIFTKEFLEHTKMLNAIRFMDAVKTNNSKQQKWSDRKLPTDPQQSFSGGIAWEYAIELANQTKKDIWINIPHAADDEYVTNLAKLVKEKLDPSLHVYLEYSNEVWNFMFTQYGWNFIQSAKDVENGVKLNYDGNKSQAYWAWRRVAQRIKEIGDIFKSVYGEENMMTKIRPILATQCGNYEITNQGLKYIQSQYGDVNKYIYAIGIAPYMQLSVSGATTKEDISNYVKNTSLPLVKDFTEGNSKIAKKYKIKLVTYEGGFDVYGTSINKDLVKEYFNSDLVQKDLVSYFSLWREITNGGLFMRYFYGASNRDEGYTYGTTTNLKNTDTFHLKAIKEYLASSYNYLTDAEWFDKGIYKLNSGSGNLSINYDLSGIISKNIYFSGASTQSGTFNVQAFSYRGGGFPFIDLMKNSTVIGANDRVNMDLDENGWPKSMKNIQTGENFEKFSTILTNTISDFDGQNLVVYYEGEGDLDFSSCTKIVEKTTPGRIVCKPLAGNLGIGITATNPNNYLRNIHVVREDYDELFKKGVIFNPKWIETIKKYKTLDFTQWVNVGVKTTTVLTNHTKINYQTYATGVPYEIMTALINALNSDGIINLPSTLSQEYIDGVKSIVSKYKLVDKSILFKTPTTTTPTTTGTGYTTVTPNYYVNSGTGKLLLKYDFDGTISKNIYVTGALTQTGVGNISTFSYWYGLPFIDLMKSSSLLSGSGTANEISYMDLDENGYPKSMINTASGTTFSKLSSIIVSKLADIDNQNLVVYYEGEGKMMVGFCSEIKEKSSSGRLVCKPTSGNVFISIMDTNKDNHLRNIHVVREDYDELFKKGVIFSPKWIETIKKYKTLDFTQWVNVGLKNTTNLANNTKVDSRTYVTGVPYEIMTALTNALNLDGVINLGSTVTQEYVDLVAQTIANYKLDTTNIKLLYKGNTVTLPKKATTVIIKLNDVISGVIYKNVLLIKDKLDGLNITNIEKVSKIENIKVKLNALLLKKPNYVNLINYYIQQLDNLKETYNYQNEINEILTID